MPLCVTCVLRVCGVVCVSCVCRVFVHSYQCHHPLTIVFSRRLKLFETDFYFKRFGKHGKGIDVETGKPYHTAKMVHRVCSRVVGCPSKMWLKVPLNEKSDNPDAFYHDIRVDEEEDIVEDGEVDEEGGNGGHGVEDRFSAVAARLIADKSRSNAPPVI